MATIKRTTSLFEKMIFKEPFFFGKSYNMFKLSLSFLLLNLDFYQFFLYEIYKKNAKIFRLNG